MLEKDINANNDGHGKPVIGVVFFVAGIVFLLGTNTLFFT